MGGKQDGYMMQSKFGIAVSSEIMAILAVAKDLKDMRERIGKIIVAYDKKGNPVTTSDLDVAGAMTAWMIDAINPNLMQTLKASPASCMPDLSPTSPLARALLLPTAWPLNYVIIM